MGGGELARLPGRAKRDPRALLKWIGWLLISIAFFLALRADDARRNWIRVEGEIVGFTSNREDEGTQAPIVDYRSPQGEPRRVEGEVASQPRAGKRGDRVPVLINPADPETVRLGTPLELWFAPGILGAIGVVLVLVGTLSGGAAGGGRLPGQLSQKRLQTLRETGERVMARVTAILAQGANATTRAPAHWRIQAVWRDATGAPRTFTSQPIGADPAAYVKIGDEIGVFVDRGNQKVYAFDFSMLPFGP